MNTRELRTALIKAKTLMDLKAIVHEILDAVEEEQYAKGISRKGNKEPTIYDAIVGVEARQEYRIRY